MGCLLSNSWILFGRLNNLGTLQNYLIGLKGRAVTCRSRSQCRVPDWSPKHCCVTPRETLGHVKARRVFYKTNNQLQWQECVRFEKRVKDCKQRILPTLLRQRLVRHLVRQSGMGGGIKIRLLSQ